MSCAQKAGARRRCEGHSLGAERNWAGESKLHAPGARLAALRWNARKVLPGRPNPNPCRRLRRDDLPDAEHVPGQSFARDGYQAGRTATRTDETESHCSLKLGMRDGCLAQVRQIAGVVPGIKLASLQCRKFAPGEHLRLSV